MPTTAIRLINVLSKGVVVRDEIAPYTGCIMFNCSAFANPSAKARDGIPSKHRANITQLFVKQ